MRTVEICSGTASFSKVAKERGHETFTIDISKRCEPDLVADINLLSIEWLKQQNFDAYWISPPCTELSIAYHGFPSKLAVATFQRAFEIVKTVKPRYYFIENPKGRAWWFVDDLPQEIFYCMYGFVYKKPTHIWTNINLNAPRCIHKTHPQMDEYHRGSKRRGIVPPKFIHAIFDLMETPL